MAATAINTMPGARPKSAADRGYLPTLDGWRAIAVSLVIGAHSVPIIGSSGLPGKGAAVSLFKHAGYGVDMFFALSGFLITTLLLVEKERVGTISLTGFYARRFFRIIPPMAVYLALALAIIPAVTIAETIFSLLFLRNYTNGSWYTGHFWSLSVEEHFYAVVPLLILLLRRHALMAVSLVLIAACVVTRWYEFSYMSSLLSSPQFRTENRVDALLVGSVIAQLFHRPAWRSLLTRWLTPSVVAAIVIAAVVALLAFESTPIRRTITAFVLPLVIVSTIVRPTSILGSTLEWRPIRYVGRLSYSLYIWQMMFLVPDGTPLGVVQEFPLAFTLSAMMAWLSYNVIEKPCIRIGHRVSRRLSTRHAPEKIKFATVKEQPR